MGKRVKPVVKCLLIVLGICGVVKFLLYSFAVAVLLLVHCGQARLLGWGSYLEKISPLVLCSMTLLCISGVCFELMVAVSFQTNNRFCFLLFYLLIGILIFSLVLTSFLYSVTLYKSSEKKEAYSLVVRLWQWIHQSETGSEFPWASSSLEVYQRELSCCGFNSARDWENIVVVSEKFRDIFLVPPSESWREKCESMTNVTCYIPSSCCRVFSDFNKLRHCVQLKSTDDIPNRFLVHQRSCLTAVKEFTFVFGHRTAVFFGGLSVMYLISVLVSVTLIILNGFYSRPRPKGFGSLPTYPTKFSSLSESSTASNSAISDPLYDDIDE